MAFTFPIPASLTREHQELHGELSTLLKLGGRTAAAAQRVATALHAHFGREEELAMPPLALLRPLADGRISPDMREAIAITDRLRAEMPRMLDEHQTIIVALDELTRAGEAEGHAEAIQFAEKLKLHAQNEEEVLYPAALVVGEILKLRLA